MPRFRSAQTNFSLGEFSPLMSARSDLPQFKGGAERLLNMRPLPQGGITTRGAMVHVATLTASPVVLIPFVFRAGQEYVLALSNGRLDAWTYAGVACTPVTGCAWTSAMLGDLGWTVAGDTTLVFNRTMPPQRILRTGATTFSVDAMPIESPPMARYVVSYVRMSLLDPIAADTASGTDTVGGGGTDFTDYGGGGAGGDGGAGGGGGSE